MDAVPFVIAAKGPRAPQTEEQYEHAKDLSRIHKWRKGDAIILAEANVLPESDMQYFGTNGERLQMMFNFEVNQNLFYALAAADSGPLVNASRYSPAACDRPMGPISAQSRRTGSRPAHRRAAGTSSSRNSAPRDGSGYMDAAFAGGSRPSSKAIGAGSKWPIA